MKCSDLTISKEFTVLIPTHYFENGEWKELNEEGENFLESEWKENIECISKLPDNLVVVEWKGSYEIDDSSLPNPSSL